MAEQPRRLQPVPGLQSVRTAQMAISRGEGEKNCAQLGDLSCQDLAN